MTLAPDQIKIGQRIKVVDFGSITSVDDLEEANTVEVTWDNGCSSDIHPEAMLPLFNETFDEVLDRLIKNGDATNATLAEMEQKLTPGYEEFMKLAAMLDCADDPYAAWETLDLILSQHKQLRQVAVATLQAHDGMFSQCAGNPITDAWGKPVDTTALNEAGRLATIYFGTHGQ